MADGNGVDQGAVIEMLKGVVVAIDRLSQQVSELQRDVAVLQRQFERMQLEIAEIRREAREDRETVLQLKREFEAFRHDLNTMRQDLRAYHGTVVGHGVLLSEVEDRLARLEAWRDAGGRA